MKRIDTTHDIFDAFLRAFYILKLDDRYPQVEELSENNALKTCIKLERNLILGINVESTIHIAILENSKYIRETTIIHLIYAGNEMCKSLMNDWYFETTDPSDIFCPIAKFMAASILGKQYDLFDWLYDYISGVRLRMHVFRYLPSFCLGNLYGDHYVFHCYSKDDEKEKIRFLLKYFDIATIKENCYSPFIHQCILELNI